MTFFKSGNFGGELQAYALQKVLLEKGYDVEVVHLLRPNNKEYIASNSFPPLVVANDPISQRSRLNAKISKYITKIFVVFGKSYHIRKQKFEEFEATHIKLSKQIFYNFDQLYELKLDYDIYIAGSDQIWNYEYPFSPEPYFLTFAPSWAKRISYAASFGHDSIPPNIVPIYKSWLESFDWISTREIQGERLVNAISCKKAITVLDPTLLISKNLWNVYLNLKKDNTEKYLLIYTLYESKYIHQKAFEIAKALNLKIKRVIPSPWTKEIYKNIEYIFDAGPIEFVNLFYNASFVLTNSFHGTAFSINFNIPFYSIPRKTKKINSRFLSLLEIVNLQDRLVFDGDKSNLLDRITVDYTVINEILENRRTESIRFLEEAIEA